MMETSQVEHKSASARQSEQGDVKEEGIDLLVMPCLLNDKLSFWTARSVDRFRGLVKPRNKKAPPPAHGTEGG